MEPEEGLVLADALADQKLKAALRPLELVASVLQLLHLLHNLPHNGVVLVDGRVKTMNLFYYSGASCHLAHEEYTVVAHAFRGDMLVGEGILGDSVDVHAGLVGKGAASHVGQPGKDLDVGNLRHPLGNGGQLGKVALRQAPAVHLQLKVRHDGGKVGVAGALTKAQEGSLHVQRPSLHRHEGEGHRQLTVVVAVDADFSSPTKAGHHLPHDVQHLQWQGAALCVTEGQHRSTTRHGGLQRLYGVVPVGLPCVKEMLRIVDDGATLVLEIGHRVTNHLQILLQSGLEDVRHLEVPGLAEDDHRLGVGRQEALKLGILATGNILPTSGTKGRHLGRSQLNLLDFLEEFQILGIGTGITRLDVGDPQLVQSLDDVNLVLHGKADSLSLGAVPQGGVKYGYVLCHCGHVYLQFASQSQPKSSIILKQLQ